MSPNARSAASASSSSPPGSDEGRRPRRRLASVTVGAVPAAAVAGRPRVGAGAPRPDAERPARVAPDDRAAAGTHGVDVDHRKTDRDARHLPSLAALRLSAGDEADVGRGAAHVERDRVLAAGERGDPLRAHDPCRPGRRRGSPPGARPPRRSSRRPRTTASRAAPAARRRRPRRRASGGTAPRPGPRYASATVVEARSYSRNSGATSWEATTCAVGWRLRSSAATAASWDGSRKEKRRQTATPRRRPAGSESSSSGATTPVRPDPLLDADAALEWDERLRVVDVEPVEMGAILPAEVQEVLEALRADEGGAGAFPLEQRVRRDGRPVGEALDLRDAGSLENHSGCRHHRLLLRAAGSAPSQCGAFRDGAGRRR